MNRTILTAVSVLMLVGARSAAAQTEPTYVAKWTCGGSAQCAQLYRPSLTSRGDYEQELPSKTACYAYLAQNSLPLNAHCEVSGASAAAAELTVESIVGRLIEARPDLAPAIIGTTLFVSLLNSWSANEANKAAARAEQQAAMERLAQERLRLAEEKARQDAERLRRLLSDLKGFGPSLSAELKELGGPSLGSELKPLPGTQALAGLKGFDTVEVTGPFGSEEIRPVNLRSADRTAYETASLGPVKQLYCAEALMRLARAEPAGPEGNQRSQVLAGEAANYMSGAPSSMPCPQSGPAFSDPRVPEAKPVTLPPDIQAQMKAFSDRQRLVAERDELRQKKEAIELLKIAMEKAQRDAADRVTAAFVASRAPKSTVADIQASQKELADAQKGQEEAQKHQAETDVVLKEQLATLDKDLNKLNDAIGFDEAPPEGAPAGPR